MLHLVPNETEVDVPVHQPKQVILRNHVLHPHIIKHRFFPLFSPNIRTPFKEDASV
jgi:hypothetical protein